MDGREQQVPARWPVVSWRPALCVIDQVNAALGSRPRDRHDEQADDHDACHGTCCPTSDR
ncbi:hypothetical protein [Geodermatophilus sp. URMC 60]